MEDGPCNDAHVNLFARSPTFRPNTSILTTVHYFCSHSLQQRSNSAGLALSDQYINTKIVIAVSRAQDSTNKPAEHATSQCTSSSSSPAYSRSRPSQAPSSTAQEPAAQQRSQYRQPATLQTHCHTRTAALPPQRVATGQLPPSLPTIHCTNHTLTCQLLLKSSGSSAVNSATATAMATNARV